MAINNIFPVKQYLQTFPDQTINSFQIFNGQLNIINNISNPNWNELHIGAKFFSPSSGHVKCVVRRSEIAVNNRWTVTGVSDFDSGNAELGFITFSVTGISNTGFTITVHAAGYTLGNAVNYRSNASYSLNSLVVKG